MPEKGTTPERVVVMGAVPAGRVEQVRAFNRFYTNVIGLLRAGLLDTQYTLTEARVIFELGAREVTEVAALRRDLDIDAGYLSRILTRLDREGLITREWSETDARRQVVRLTARGRDEYAMLSARSSAQVERLLATLGDDDQARLTAAMGTIRGLLGGGAAERSGAAPLTLRPLRPGDAGWVVHRHGALYAEEYGWDASFEALVARIVADYLQRRQSQTQGREPRETGWIAEVGGARAGSVFCMRKDDETAQLRLLLVEPWARGAGVGSRLVAECIAFARAAGYSRMVLWTVSTLVEARRLYERAGFTLVREEPQHGYGHDLVSQDWSLPLTAAPVSEAPGD